MRNMRKLGIVFIAAISLSMAACGASIPEMSEEQNAQVVEYAAGLLLKYDENYHGRLIEEEEREEAAPETDMQESQEEPVSDQTEDKQDETPVIDISEEPEETVYSSIEEFYGIEGVTITYVGYELKDMYPDEGGEDMFFAMSASKDCKLMVLNFDVANTSGQDLRLDMLSLGAKFKISINGETPRYVLTTMLTNDLGEYVGTISAGSSENLVLVSEVPEDQASSIQSVSLMMKNVAEDATISLN